MPGVEFLRGVPLDRIGGNRRKSSQSRGEEQPQMDTNPRLGCGSASPGTRPAASGLRCTAYAPSVVGVCCWTRVAFSYSACVRAVSASGGSVS